MRRLDGGGSRSYLGNGSEADIEHPEGGPVRGEQNESNLIDMRPQ
jgi:hypothetical protein